MLRSPSRRVFARAALVVGPALIPLAASAQAFEVAPTFQASFASPFAEVVQSRWQAWGVMAGYERPGAWSPHVWFQRYALDSDCASTLQTSRDCRTHGWTVSVGPALRFIDTDRVTGHLLTQVGLDSRNSTGFSGGTGLHVGVKLGVFQPHAFSRVDVFRGVGYTTVGVGLRLRIADRPDLGTRGWER